MSASESKTLAEQILAETVSRHGLQPTGPSQKAYLAKMIRQYPHVPDALNLDWWLATVVDDAVRMFKTPPPPGIGRGGLGKCLASVAARRLGEMAAAQNQSRASQDERAAMMMRAAKRRREREAWNR